MIPTLERIMEPEITEAKNKAMSEGMREGMFKGMRKGRLEGKIELLLDDGFPISKIAERLDITEDKVITIIENMEH